MGPALFWSLSSDFIFRQLIAKAVDKLEKAQMETRRLIHGLDKLIN